METIYRDIRSIAADERRIYESVVGHALDDDQCVIIRVIYRSAELDSIAHGESSEWSNEKNSRRCRLIDKQIEGTLSPNEAIELDELQRQAIAYRDAASPLPMEGAIRLHSELLEKQRHREAKD